jgi:hypothetical protein
MYWGPSYWRFIHYFAMYEERDLVTQIKNFIPCETCKTEWYDPAPTEKLLDWSRELHNKVNMKLGKYANWDARDLSITHKPHCDICEKQEFIHRFPWDFIHEVAKQPNSMEFLKEFNAKYPCEIHRATFLDEPQLDEKTFPWTIRNHQRLDPAFSLPPFITLDPDTGNPVQAQTGPGVASTTGQPCPSCPSAMAAQLASITTTPIPDTLPPISFITSTMS